MRRYILFFVLLIRGVSSSAQYNYVFIPINQAVLFDKEKHRLMINPTNGVVNSFGLIPATQAEVMNLKGGSQQHQRVVCIATAPVILVRSCPSGSIEYMTVDALYRSSIQNSTQIFVLFKHPPSQKKEVFFIKASFL